MAMRSSMMRTRWPGATPSSCISKCSRAYSLGATTQAALRGSLPFLRMTVRPSLSSRARAAAKRKPRDSIPARISGPERAGPGGQLVDGEMEGLGALDDGGDVLEDDARLGEVGDVEDVIFEIDAHGVPYFTKRRPVCAIAPLGTRTQGTCPPSPPRNRQPEAAGDDNAIGNATGDMYPGYVSPDWGILEGMAIDYSLYLVADADFAGGSDLPALVDAAVRGGVTVVQLRAKSLGGRAFVGLALEIARRLAGTGVPLLINDRVDIALACGAAGVHLGQDDMPVPAARRILGPDAAIGVSVNTPEEAALGGERRRGLRRRRTGLRDRRRKRRRSPSSDRRASRGSSAPSASPSWPSAASRPGTPLRSRPPVPTGSPSSRPSSAPRTRPGRRKS